MLTHVVVYRHNPKSVALWHLNGVRNVRIVAPATQFDNYREAGIDIRPVLFIEEFTTPNIEGTLDAISGPLCLSTLAEQDMIEVAQLADRLSHSASGQLARAQKFGDKLWMRTAAYPHVPQPDFTSVVASDTPRSLVERGFGILKPRRGMGCSGVEYLKSMDDSNDTFSGDSFIAEEIVPHVGMVTCDGYAVNGAIRRFYVHEYGGPFLDSIVSGGIVHIGTSSLYLDSADALAELYEMSTAVLEAFDCRGARVQPFHFEFFITADGSPVFGEVGGRFGGGEVPRLIYDAWGVDVLREYWAILLGGEPPSGHIELDCPPRRFSRRLVKLASPGTVLATPREEQLHFSESADVHVSPGETRTSGVEHCEDRIATVVLSASTHRELGSLTERASKILNEGFVIQECSSDLRM